MVKKLVFGCRKPTWTEGHYCAINLHLWQQHQHTLVILTNKQNVCLVVNSQKAKTLKLMNLWLKPIRVLAMSF